MTISTFFSGTLYGHYIGSKKTKVVEETEEIYIEKKNNEQPAFYNLEI